VTAGAAPLCSQAGLNVSAEMSLQIAPNPVSENFQIISETTILAAELFTLDGKQVELLRISQTEFSVLGLSTGTYFLKVFADGAEKLIRLKVSKH
jgi:hypothetical protein